MVYVWKFFKVLEAGVHFGTWLPKRFLKIFKYVPLCAILATYSIGGACPYTNTAVNTIVSFNFKFIAAFNYSFGGANGCALTTTYTKFFIDYICHYLIPPKVFLLV